MLFARYAKKLVQVAHSPPESDGMIGKSIKCHIKQKIYLDSVTKLRCQKSGGLQGLLWKKSGAQAWKCAAALYFSVHTEKQLEGTLVLTWPLRG